MKVGKTIKFPGTSGLFAVVLKEEKGQVAIMFKDGEVRWFRKETLEKKDETS